MQKFLNVLPTFVFGVASYGWVAMDQSVAAEIEPIGNSVVTLRSTISEHTETMWSSLSRAYGYQSNSQLPLVVSQLEDHKSYENTDLIELQLHDAISACDSGELNLLPLHKLFPKDDSYVRQVVANGVQPCSLGHSLWATIVTYDEARYSVKSSPKLIQDFFNVDAFPGKRAIKKSPHAFVEWVLLNNGYPSNQIYSVMALEQAWVVIEKSLTAMANEIVWVNSDQEALDLIDTGAVTFAAVSSKSLVRKVAMAYSAERRYGVIWDGAIAHMSMLAIPKKSSASEALQLLRYITDSTRNVQMSSSYGYAPVQTAHTDLIEDRYRYALPMDAQLNNLVWGNSKWWREEGAELEALFFKFINQTTSTASNATLVDEVVSSL